MANYFFIVTQKCEKSNTVRISFTLRRQNYVNNYPQALNNNACS